MAACVYLFWVVLVLTRTGSCLLKTNTTQKRFTRAATNHTFYTLTMQSFKTFSVLWKKPVIFLEDYLAVTSFSDLLMTKMVSWSDHLIKQVCYNSFARPQNSKFAIRCLYLTLFVSQWPYLFPHISACFTDYYGEGCAEECSCGEGNPCNHITGECTCPSGFSGNECSLRKFSFLFNLFETCKESLKGGVIDWSFCQQNAFFGGAQILRKMKVSKDLVS